MLPVRPPRPGRVHRFFIPGKPARMKGPYRMKAGQTCHARPLRAGPPPCR